MVLAGQFIHPGTGESISFKEALARGYVDARMTSVVTDDGETIGLTEAIQRGIVDAETGCVISEYCEQE